MFARITPLVRLPSSADVFDYFVPAELQSRIKPGHLVNIPWRSKKVPGVVLSLAKSQESARFRARPIGALIEDTPVLTPLQLRLITRFSEYYFVAPGSVARMIVPERPARTVPITPPAYPHIPFSVSLSQLPKLKQVAEAILPSPLGKSRGEGPQLVHIEDVSSFVWLLHYLMRHDSARQLLVLIPTIEMILAIAGSVQKKYSDKLAVVHSSLSKNALWSEYQKILSGRARSILSTRQGVFLPIQSKSRIIFFDSASDDFKQYDQHPRYDSRIVGAWLAESTAPEIFYASSSPILGEKGHAQAHLPLARRGGISVALVDMKNEMHRKDFSIIGGQTLDAIKDVLGRNKKTVVIALREESEKGVSVRSILAVLTQELKNCKVSASSNDFDVLIATPAILEGLKLSSKKQNLELLVFASIEPLLAIPDYRSGERALYRLKHWEMLARELGFARIMLQSYAPDSRPVRAFACGEFETFRDEELNNRKELNYPPFSKLIKLSYRGSDARAVEEFKKKLKPKLNISGPFTDSDKHPSLLIKLTPDADLSPLGTLGPDWIMDRDPENVL